MTGIKPSRRQVVRAGAWTVPVVAVATTAPAFAASGANMKDSSAPKPTRTNKSVISGTLTVKNSGTAATSALIIKVDIGDPVDPSLTAHTAPAGYTVLSATGNVVTFKAGSQQGAGVTITGLTYTVIRSGPSNNDATVTITIDPGGGGTAGTFGPYTNV